jgi:CubicO group peptidase (beta-lactamase class C family)
MLAATLLAASFALTPAQRSHIDGVVADVMHSEHIAGLSLGIARNGHVLLARGYGFRDLAKQAGADAQTIYRIGSITKQFTAALVIRQAERGVLRYDSTIDGATVAQLLSQTSGIPSYTDPGETLEHATNATKLFEPGTQWHYSNTNYYLLGKALESATHATYPALLEAQIVRPLHLTGTSFALPAGNDVATGYAWNGSAFVPVTPGPNADAAAAFSAGALSSNVTDLLRWLDALETGAVIAPESFTAMTASGTLTDGTFTHYGFGFFIDDWYGWTVAEHPGLIDGFSGGDAIGLADDLNVVVLTNANEQPVAPLEKSIFAIVEPPKNPALVATLAGGALNEDPAITAAVTALANNPALVRWFGGVELVEYVQAARPGGTPSYEYRVTYERGRLLFAFSWQNGTIAALTIERAR